MDKPFETHAALVATYQLLKDTPGFKAWVYIPTDRAWQQWSTALQTMSRVSGYDIAFLTGYPADETAFGPEMPTWTPKRKR